MKVCGKCRQKKPLSAFYLRGDRPGYRSACRECLRRGDRDRARRRELRAAWPERSLLRGVIQRCTNPKNPSYRDYGGRGITICERWRLSFADFFDDVGPRPSPGHSLERIDNDRGYEPGNVRWATKKEQNRNTRKNVYITINGRTQCLSAWAEESGVADKAIRDRMKKLGWDPERAVFTPQRRCKRRAA